jgi:large subunit ribosomal protein L15
VGKGEGRRWTVNLHDVNQKVKRKPARHRVGRGGASGWGCSAGRGPKGAASRSGWRLKLFREGGQMPIGRRMPKRGFNNALFTTRFSFVNLRDLNQFPDGTVVTPELCLEKLLIPKVQDGLKVLGHGELERKLTIRCHRISRTAREAVEKKGGTIELLKVAGDDARSAWKARRGQGKTRRRREARAPKKKK